MHNDSNPTNEWLCSIVPMAELCGYRTTPIYSFEDDEPKHYKYADGQHYGIDSPYWKNGLNDRVGVVLDEAVLVDWDGYKPGAPSLAELAAKLQITEIELRGAEVQNDPTKDSKHFLFRLPENFERSTIKASNNGFWLKHVDIKTANQLMYVKPHKQLRRDTLPFKCELQPVPQIIIDEALKKEEAPENIGESRNCSEQNTKALDWLHEDCRTLATSTENRNSTLNDFALKHGKRAAGGLLDATYVQNELLAAYLASGKNKSSFNSTWRSAWRKAQNEPVNDIGPVGIDPSKVFGTSNVTPLSPVSGRVDTKKELLNICKANTYDSIASIAPFIVDTLNRNHCVLMHGGKTVIAERKPDHKGNIFYEFASVPQVKEFLSNLNFTYLDGDKPKQSNCFTTWMRSLDRKTFQGVIFDPSPKGGNGDYLNLWDGFAVEAVPGDDKLDPIMWHLRNIICCGNEDHFRYLLAWLAQIIQQPHIKTGVALVLRSIGKGTGKSTVSVIMERMLKHHAIRLQDGKHLLGAFNNHLANKLFVTIEEAFWAGNPADAGKLKTMVTENTLIHEAKNRDAVMIDSHHRFLMCTNNEWVVPTDRDERRWFVLDVSEDKKQSDEYFKPLYASIDNDQTIGQLFNFLLHYDLSPFDLRKAPVTEAVQEQIMLSLPSEANWLRTVLDDGVISDGFVTYPLDTPANIPNRTFRDSYLNYCREHGVKSYDIKNDRVLGKYIRNTLKLSSGPRIASPLHGSKRVTTTQTKSIEDMQQAFDEYYKYQ